MHIAFFQPSQTETVVDLLRDMSIHYNGLNASDRPEIKRNFIENVLGDHSGVRLVIAAEDNRAVGLASISILYPASKERGQLFMKEMYVVSGCRGRGIGKALMRFVARYAVEKSCIRFDWTVDTTNPSALAFYRSLGAKPAPDKIYFRLAASELERFASVD